MRAPLTSVLLSLHDCETLTKALKLSTMDGSIYGGSINDLDEVKIINTRLDRIEGKLARATRRLKRKAPTDG